MTRLALFAGVLVGAVFWSPSEALSETLREGAASPGEVQEDIPFPGVDREKKWAEALGTVEVAVSGSEAGANAITTAAGWLLFLHALEWTPEAAKVGAAPARTPASALDDLAAAIVLGTGASRVSSADAVASAFAQFSWVFQDLGRVDALVGSADRVIPPLERHLSEPWVAWVTAADQANGAGLYGAADRMLKNAGNASARVGDPAKAVLRVACERLDHCIGTGAEALVPGRIEEIERVLEDVDDLNLRYWGVNSLFDAANALDVEALHDSARERWSEWLATAAAQEFEVSNEMRGRVHARMGAGKLELLRDRGAAIDPAVQDLKLASELLGPDNELRWLADLRLVDAAIEAGQLEEARMRVREIDSWSAAHGVTVRGRHATDLLVARARLALAGRGALDPAELSGLAALYRELRTRLDEKADAWSELVGLGSGRGWTHTRDRMALLEVTLELALACGDEGRRAREACEILLGLAGRASLTRALGGSAASLDVLMDGTAANGGVLLLCAGAHKSYAFAAAREGDGIQVSAHVLPSSYDCLGYRRRLRDAVRSALRRRSADLGGPRMISARRAASDALLGGALRDKILAWDSLVVVGNDGFGSMPFELLSVDGDEPMGVSHAISYVSSPGASLVLRQRANASAYGSTIVVADALAAPGERTGAADGDQLVATELHEAEIADIESAWGPGGVRHVRTSEAEWRADGAFRKTGLLSFFGHGVDVPNARGTIGLLVGEGTGRILAPGDIETMAELPSIVVVAACGAWDAPVRRGDDGRHHVVGAMHVAGANTVVASEAALDLELALRQSQEFLRGVRDGKRPSVALRDSRRELRAEFGLRAFLLRVAGSDEPASFDAVPAEKKTSNGRLVFGLMGLGLLGASALLAFAMVRRRPGASRHGARMDE